MMPAEKTNALVLGASGGLAQALIAGFLADQNIETVIAVSSKPAADSVQAESGLLWIQTEYAEPAMAEVVEQLKDYSGSISRVCICHGLLHTDSLWPEKRLEDIDPKQLQAYFEVNTILPAIWLKNLIHIMPKGTPSIIAFLSARVGSISDNKLGGWYGYRASKSALNMLIKNAAIEYGRRNKHVSLMAYHPGTVDTGLSKPFQANVKADKLFTPEFTAQCLIKLLVAADVENSPFYLDWDGKTIPW